MATADLREPTSWEANVTTTLGSVECPMQGCVETFDCDACMHLHLLENYNLRYAEVFGPVHNDAWLDFCDRHATFSAGALGA
jgi:hypothetical protein